MMNGDDLIKNCGPTENNLLEQDFCIFKGSLEREPNGECELGMYK